MLRIKSIHPEAAGEPHLHIVRQHTVGEQERRHPGEEDAGERRETEKVGRGRKGQPDPDGHDQERRQHHGFAGPALEERNPLGPDDVHDEGLRQERLDEPTGMEQGRGIGGTPRA